MVGQPQPRDDVGSQRSRVIVGAIRPRVIVGSARARPTPDGTPRPQLAAEESPRPRVIFGTPRARVIVGSPRPRVIVSSPWPAVVVASPRPRAPVGSPWPRVVVGTPRPRVIVGSPRARVAGADPASALLRAPWKAAGRMNILAPVRRDRVLAELPQCLRKEAALHVHKDFHPRVTCACQEHRTGTVGFKISKIIVVGDLSVGKTCLINRFCKDTFDKNYKATIGVDFEMERFEVLGIPFSLQLWDTAGQERFKCIASTYYRGAQAIIVVFNLNDVASLEHTKQWLADALKENDPSSVLLFLTPAQYALMEKDALQVAQEMKAEYWAVSSLTGENVREFFFRVAALTFEANVLAELEKSGAQRIGDVVRINSDDSNLYLTASKKKPTCCP
uniref:Ras-related protein Rab-34 n=1 Tax=Macaca fascicularis TaxID=9541 RepID=G7PTY1_MACFA